MPEQSNNPVLDGITGNNELSKDDILDILNDESTDAEAEGAQTEEEATPQKQKGKDKEKKDDTEEESGEEDEEEPEPDELELNLVTPVRRKEILAKYPEIFKDFPYLQTAYYRDQQFTEVFPTVDDAKEAQNKANILDQFEQDLGEGNFSKVLANVKENDPEKFNNIVDNYLMQLGQVDKDAATHIISNVVKNSVINVLRLSQGMGGEQGDQLKEAAILFYRAIFQSDKIEPPTLLGKKSEVDPEREKLKAERQEFVRQRFEAAREGLNTKVQNSIKSTIDTHIDPKKSMPDYVRKNAIRDAQESLDGLMERDTRFSKYMDKLWEAAFNSNFSQASLEQIRSTYLSKAKTLLPQVIKNARNEALRSTKNASRDENKDRRGPLPMGGHSTQRTSSSANRSSSSSAKEIPKGMKTLDYINSD